jgi:hypothetical protein
VSWPGRAWARLMPAERRAWAEAVWAEAPEVAGYWQRLAWRAGGVRLIAREAQMVRRTGTLLVFGAAAGAAVWSAWPGSAVGDATAVRVCIIVVVLLLAGLPLLVRWWLGPAGNLAARWLRAGCYAAILAAMPAVAVTQRLLGSVPRGGRDLHVYDAVQGPGVPGSVSAANFTVGDVAIVIITAIGVAVILALTARRVPVTPAALAIGAGAGLVLGAAMYAVDPLGLNKYVTAPWLHGSWTDMIPAGRAQHLVALAWIMLFCAPAAAGFLAGWRCHVPGPPEQVAAARAWQGSAAGLAAGIVGALSVTVSGIGTTALLVKSAWVRDLLYHGQHLTSSVVYGRELTAIQNTQGYDIICIAFPLIGALAGITGAAFACLRTSPQPGGGRPPGPAEPEPLPGPAGGGRQIMAEADQVSLADRCDDDGAGLGDQDPPGLVDTGAARAF